MRHKLASKRVCGEAASGSLIIMEERRAKLLATAQGLVKHDKYNMDEKAYVYCTPPHNYVSNKAYAGPQDSKETTDYWCYVQRRRIGELSLLFLVQHDNRSASVGRLAINFASTTQALQRIG